MTLAAFVLAASFFTDTAQAAEKLSIEQVKLAPPDMDVYVHTSADSNFDSVKPSDITADLDGQSYSVQSIENEGNTTEGVFYAFLLDVSASIPQDSLDAAVDAPLGHFAGPAVCLDILCLCARLEPQSLLLLLLFLFLTVPTAIKSGRR